MVPVLLNIWGVIMFLRLGWVTGQAGGWGATAVVLLSNVVTGITALSLCAICTNGEVKGGGAYYLISRALGPQFGGSIGVVFFFAQAVATSLYVVGFCESLIDLYADNKAGNTMTGDILNDIRIIGIIVCIVLLAVALVGVSWYAKTQVGLLVLLVVSIISVFIGAFFPSVPDEDDNAAAGFLGLGRGSVETDAIYSVDVDSKRDWEFFGVLSIFFPAATGIMAGANMSGDLARPSVAIPRGTLWGIFVTCLTYLALVWVLAAACVPCAGQYCGDITATVGTASVTYKFGSTAWVEFVTANDAVPTGGLIFNKLIMAQMSIWSPLVYVGVFAATLSSALASLVGAPRILQALARDRLFPFKALSYFGQLDSTKPKGHAAAGGGSAANGAAAPVVPSAVAEDLDNVAEDDELTGESPEPKRAYFLTFFIACGCVLIGKLDIIAPVISNFFMISYAMTNYACFAVSMADTPAWRPSFKYYNKWLSGFGALLCLAVMFAFDWANSLVSVLLCAALYKYLDWKDPPKNWGPASDANRYIAAVRAMYKLRQVRTDRSGNQHIKNYRPAILVLADDPRSDAGKAMVSFVAKLYKGRGMALIAQVLQPGQLPGLDEYALAAASQQRQRNQKLLDRAVVGYTEQQGGESGSSEMDGPAPIGSAAGVGQYGKQGAHLVAQSGLSALALTQAQREGLYAEVVVAQSLREGVHMLLQVGGLGILRPNCLLFNFPEEWHMLSPAHAGKPETREFVQQFEGAMLDGVHAQRALMVLRDPRCMFNDAYMLKPLRRGLAGAAKEKAAHSELTSPNAPGVTKTIDVWWLGDEGGLAVLIPFILQRNEQFVDHVLRVFTTGTPDARDNDATMAAQERSLKLSTLLAKLRFESEALSLKCDLSGLSDDTVREFNQLITGLLPEPEPSQADQAARAPPAPADGSAAPDVASPAEVTANPTQAPEQAQQHGEPLFEVDDDELGTDLMRVLQLETRRQLRSAELIRQHSSQANVVFIVAPAMRRHLPVGLYMAWLEVLSAQLPPTVLIRGNGLPVVTLAT